MKTQRGLNRHDEVNVDRDCDRLRLGHIYGLDSAVRLLRSRSVLGPGSTGFRSSGLFALFLFNRASLRTIYRARSQQFCATWQRFDHKSAADDYPGRGF